MNRFKAQARPGIRWMALVVAMLMLVLPAEAEAQALDATIRLNQPAPSVSHRLQRLRDADPDRPRVAIVRNTQLRGDLARSASTVRDAVYYWEILLLGLQVPFETVNSDDLSRGVSKGVEVVIFPASDALSARQRRSLRTFVRKGGALLASGQTGAYDDRGRPVDDTFFGELFGAQHVTRVPDQPFGILHSIDARSPLGYGIPPGHRINIAAQTPFTAASPVTARALGHPYSYSGRDDQRLENLTLMLAHDFERGRAIWFRFNPQDVSRERADQTAYQRAVVNALAYLSGAETISVRPWPHAANSALAVTALPTVGFDALSYLSGYRDFLGLLRSSSAPATFFLSSEEAIGFPDLVAEMSQFGEIALAAESDDVMLGQPLDIQMQRLDRARSILRAPSARGLYPPGGFHDGNTVRASLESEFGYLLLPSRTSLAPSLVRWWEDVDYRALSDPSDMVDLAFLRTRQQERVRRVEPDPAIAMPLDSGIGPYEDRFEAINEAGGLYVLPFYPESERGASARSRQLRETLIRAVDRGAWMATLSDVNVWWSDRSHLAVTFAESSRDAVAFDVLNDADHSIDGVTIELRLGDVGFESMEADGLDAELMTGDRDGTFLLRIDRLPPGSSRIRMILY